MWLFKIRSYGTSEPWWVKIASHKSFVTCYSKLSQSYIIEDWKWEQDPNILRAFGEHDL